MTKVNFVQQGKCEAQTTSLCNENLNLKMTKYQDV